MSERISSQRQEFGIGVIGGPATVVDIAGLRFVMDPTFDEPGPRAYLTKLEGPAVDEAGLGDVDVVLVSHAAHPDNLDVRGKEYALAAKTLLTGANSAKLLGATAKGLEAWETITIPRGDGGGDLTVQAVPAEHGPADGDRDDTGHINSQVIGFVLSGTGLPTVYLSGDNASVRVAAEIANKVGPIDVAVLFAGAARVAAKFDGRPLTLTSERAAAVAAVLGAKTVLPAHIQGWAHFSEGIDTFRPAFDDAGLAHVLALAEPGEWNVVGKQS
ncbi:MBL fold metallo-hydrolase [Amycolatopsis sp. NPDC005232]|uniref:MBL fold metallo-hydrolase n=1 Tax=Amycolatopsis sp. NPDC005232 TaxID=3157027 RepID=UPI0033ADFE0A